MAWNFCGLGGGTEFKKARVITSASQLAGALDSSVEYIIDGVIDMGSQSI